MKNWGTHHTEIRNRKKRKDGLHAGDKNKNGRTWSRNHGWIKAAGKIQNARIGKAKKRKWVRS